MGPMAPQGQHPETLSEHHDDMSHTQGPPMSGPAPGYHQHMLPPPQGMHGVPPMPMPPMMAGGFPIEPIFELTKTQRRHLEIKERIEALERTFLSKREKIFEDKMQNLNEQIVKLNDGSDVTLVAYLDQLKKKREILLYNASIASENMVQRAKQDFEYENEMMMAEFEAEKIAIKKKLLDAIADRKQRLHDDRESFDISIENFLDSTSITGATTGGSGFSGPGSRSGRKTTRSTKFATEERRSEKRSRNQKPVLAPPFVHEAQESEIADDLSAIRGKNGPGPNGRNGKSSDGDNDNGKDGNDDVVTSSGRRVGSRRSRP